MGGARRAWATTVEKEIGIALGEIAKIARLRLEEPTGDHHARLDTARGLPASGVPIVLEHASDDGWESSVAPSPTPTVAPATSWPRAPRCPTAATG